MASLSFAFTTSLSTCPGAWPVTEPSSPTDHVATRSERAPHLTRPSPKRKQNAQPGKQTTLGRAHPIPPWSKRRPYSVSSSSPKWKQIRDQVLRQTTIKQYAENGHPTLSLEDVNELSKALARLFLPEPRSSYNRIRTSIYKRNKAYRKRLFAVLPFCRCRAYRLTPESSGPSSLSTFPSTPRSAATSNRTPLSTSPSSLEASQQSQRRYSNGIGDFHRIPSPSPSPPPEEPSPCPPGPRHSRNLPAINGPLNRPVTQTYGISSRHIEPELQPEVQSIRVSSVSEFTRHPDQRTPNIIDYNIAKYLLEQSRKLKDKRIGFVYVLSRPTSEGFVKIGKTMNIDERVKKISRGGAYGNLTPHNHCRQRPFRHYALTETIIKDELYNILYESVYNPNLREGQSPPGKESGRTEWYNTNHEHANEVISKWRDWFDCEPYDDNGELVDFWRKKIENREKYDETKHGDIHARWSSL